MADQAEKEDAIYLAATNFLVDNYNRKRLIQLDGNHWYSDAADEGLSRVLDGITGCRKGLYLKIGAPVIITQNDSDVCNGTRGVVQSLEADKLSIRIKLLDGKTVTLKPKPFTRSQRGVLHTRHQLPVKLAWGLTIHRSQGQTFSGVIIDCRGLILSNQLGVALSRVREDDDISIRNFTTGSLDTVDCELRHFLETGQPPIQVGCIYNKEF